MTIKAIETVYNGYKFRSRLEARWAVFFDEAGIKYEYEPEGFEARLKTSLFSEKEEIIRYLPDFYLPEFDTYCEVKPNDKKLFEDSLKLALMVDCGGPMSNGLILLGQIPYYKSTWDKSPFPAHDMLYCHKGVIVKRIRFKMRRHDYPTELLTVCDFIDMNCVGGIPEKATVEATFYDESCNADKDKGLEQYAYKAARQARFEYGETPVKPYCEVPYENLPYDYELMRYE